MLTIIPPFFALDYQRQRQHLIRMENYKLAVFPVTLSLNPFKKNKLTNRWS